MAATFFTVPIASPPHPDLFKGLSSSDQVSGSWFATLPQPIYPPPSSSGSGQGKTTAPQTQTTPAPTPAPTPKPQPDQSGTESWVDRMRRRYGIGGN